jgi:hypothetical protein
MEWAASAEIQQHAAEVAVGLAGGGEVGGVIAWVQDPAGELVSGSVGNGGDQGRSDGSQGYRRAELVRVETR